jgi:hypothetical protein
MRHRASVVALGGLLSLVAAGCGGSTKTVTQKVVDTVTAPAAATTATSSAPITTSTSVTTPSGPPSCTAVAFKTAHCTLGGVSFTVAHGTQTLRLKTLALNITGVRTTSTVANNSISATAKGEFLIVTISVTNKTTSPETFDGGGFQQQSELELDGASYTESFHAENQADAQSFITNNSPIQPGESATGDLVFDVPPAEAAKATTDSRDVLIIGNFGDDLSQQQPSKLGLIALSGA